jgi:hypothetical protein
MSPTTHDLLVHSTNIFGAAVKAMVDLSDEKKSGRENTILNVLTNHNARLEEQLKSPALGTTIGRNTVQS